jgi:hypothetical protein
MEVQGQLDMAAQEAREHVGETAQHRVHLHRPAPFLPELGDRKELAGQLRGAFGSFAYLGDAAV